MSDFPYQEGGNTTIVENEFAQVTNDVLLKKIYELATYATLGNTAFWQSKVSTLLQALKELNRRVKMGKISIDELKFVDLAENLRDRLALLQGQVLYIQGCLNALEDNQAVES